MRRLCYREEHQGEMIGTNQRQACKLCSKRWYLRGSSCHSLRDLAVVSEAQLDCGSINRLIRWTYSGQVLDFSKELRFRISGPWPSCETGVSVTGVFWEFSHSGFCQ